LIRDELIGDWLTVYHSYSPVNENYPDTAVERILLDQKGATGLYSSDSGFVVTNTESSLTSNSIPAVYLAMDIPRGSDFRCVDR
jgi:hypothetical protein